MKRKMYFLSQTGMDNFIPALGLMVFAFCSGRGSNFLVVASACALAVVLGLGNTMRD
jgi:hypothetical protein